MMKSLFRLEGAQLSIDILSDPAVRSFIDSHAGILDSSFEEVDMSETMRSHLRSSNWVFSGMKTFHELNEAFPSLLDDNGDRKPFERFLNDVLKIDKTYNSNYLRAEYNFVTASAQMAAKWEEIEQDGDRYNLQYRTQGDGRVRPEHAALDGVTLPPSDPFWQEFYPPNGWNCRCDVVQVRKSKYPASDPTEARIRGEEALRKDYRRMFRFNPGKERKTFPDYNPYTISRCRNCDLNKDQSKLSRRTPPDNQLCAACRFLRNCENDINYDPHPKWKGRLLINKYADKLELEDNIRAASAILSSFNDIAVRIRPHVIEENVKNPEYIINGLIADRKGIMSDKGVADAFLKAIKQGCQAVVIDLDMHFKDRRFNYSQLAKRINWRSMDFDEGLIKECYVIHNNKSVKISTEYNSRNLILDILQKLKQ